MKKARPFSLTNFETPFHPWIYFALFLVFFALLSYFPCSPLEKLGSEVVGLLIPFLYGSGCIFRNRSITLRNPFPPDSSGSIPFWLFFPFLFFLLVTRFYKLTTLPFWPIGDEGIFSNLAMGLSKHWNWNPLVTDVRVEALPVWLLSFFLKMVPPSLFAIRLFPVLVSLATSVSAYWASRQFVSKGWSFIFCWLMSLSFWELTQTRFCMNSILTALFQCLCFGWLGLFLKSREARAKWKALFILSFWAGLGFYTFTNWAVVWLSIGILFCGYFLYKKPSYRIFGLVFLVISLLLASPWMEARLGPGGMNHVQGNFKGFSSFFGTTRLYLRGIFWDGSASFPFGPVWGGFLNPLLDALVLLGFFQVFRSFKPLPLLGLLLCAFLYILPGSLSSGMELHRILPEMVFFMALAVLGLQNLLSNIRGEPLWMGTFCLLVASFSLDVYHYVGRYCDIRYSPPGQQWRSVEYSRAYEILNSLYRSDGPIDVFTEFNLDYDDKTLNVADYPLDALQNPLRSPNQPRWAAILCNIQYAPFLQKRFPDLKTVLLNPDLPPQDLHHSLGILLIPVVEISSQTLGQWIQAHEIYRTVNLNVKNKNPLSSWEQFVGQFASIRDLSKNDPFLDSIYWEKVASFQVMAGDFPAAAQSYQKALQEGYPMDHLRHNLARARQLADSKTIPVPLH